jgi:hypothetical protein
LQKSLRSYGYVRFLRLGPTQDPSFLTRHLNVDLTLDRPYYLPIKIACIRYYGFSSYLSQAWACKAKFSMILIENHIFFNSKQL